MLHHIYSASLPQWDRREKGKVQEIVGERRGEESCLIFSNKTKYFKSVFVPLEIHLMHPTDLKTQVRIILEDSKVHDYLKSFSSLAYMEELFLIVVQIF